MKSIKSFFKENIIFIIILIIITIITVCPLPYYVQSPGGLTNVNEKIKVGDLKINGSYNLTYINEYKATLPILIYSYIKKDFDIYKKKDILLDNETDNEYNLRDKLFLDESLSNAVVAAYKKANKKVTIKSNYLYVGYILEDSKTDIKVGDRILSIDGNNVSTKEEVNELLSKNKIGDKIKITVLNNNKKYERSAKIYNINKKNVIGFIPIEVYDYETKPKINIEMSSNESGSSGGLMLSLAIYDILTKKDLAKGRTIAGTGTIDKEGNVGKIGGIKYKIKTAAKNKVDVFFIPKSNYKEAISVVKKFNLNINLVSVKTLEDAITYLKK